VLWTTLIITTSCIDNEVQTMSTFLKILAPLAALIAGAAAAADSTSERSAVAVTQLSASRLELVYAGEKFSSRDAAEAHLLLSAAENAKRRGADWFKLAHKSEGHPGNHPPRADQSYGPAYRHWQPHWLYQVAGQEWQPWYPEWGARFWAEETDLRTVQRFEVHAIIELGQGALPKADAVFDPKPIMADGQLKLAARQP
jgi:hypothetical protein